jgi:hypothetical protein
MKKNALIFIDGQVVKIVFGNSLKVIPPQDITLSHNVSFLDKLFAEHRVLYVDRAGEMSLADFVDGVAAKLGQKDEPQPKLPPSALVGPQRQAKPLPQPRREQPEAGQWIKSNAKTIIIIDDLMTNEELAPGIKKALSMPPGRAICLGSLDADKVAASQTLRRLIQNGTLSFTDPEEAVRLESEHEERVRDENDARLEQYAPIIEGSARAAAERGMSSTVSGHDAPMVDITDDQPSRPNPEDSGTMSDLMSMIEDGAGITAAGLPEEPVAPSPRLQRPPRDGQASPDSLAKKIGRKHGAE